MTQIQQATDSNQNGSETSRRSQRFVQGIVAAIPLSIAVIPWGILAGSYAMDAGLTMLEAQAMSAILFAGAAQLVAAGMFKAGVGLTTMLITTFIITSRHFLYSVAMRDRVSQLSGKWRAVIGFLLTDELFAICSARTGKPFDRWFALGAGGSFYIVWNIASFAGIMAGDQFPQLNEIGLDFAVAATFIALVIPQIISLPIVVAVLVSLFSSLLLTAMHIEGVLILSSLLGMLAGYLFESVIGREAFTRNMDDTAQNSRSTDSNQTNIRKGEE